MNTKLKRKKLDVAQLGRAVVQQAAKIGTKPKTKKRVRKS